MSHERRRNRLAMAAMRKLAVVFPHDGEEVELRNIRGVRVIGTQAHWHAVDQMQHVWWVGLLVQTKNFIHIEVFNPEDGRQCRHAQIADAVKQKHCEMVAEYEDYGIVSTGWVASITEIDEDDVLAFQRLEQATERKECA